MAIDITVAASADDASESAGTVSIIANPLANCTTSGVWNGWRFTGITIPANAIITSAYLTVRFTSSTLDEPDVTIYGQNVASPATFTTAANSISTRARTAANVAWANANAGVADIQTSSLVTIVQELVNNWGPYSSGAMVMLMTTRAAVAARDTSVTSYDGSTTVCARLHIDFNLQLLPFPLNNNSTVYAPVLALLVSLAPAKLTNAPTVYAPTFAMGAISITPSLLTDADTVYAPTLAMGAISLTPTLLTDPDTVYAPTLTVAALTLTPAKLTNSSTVYAPTLTVAPLITLSPAKLTNAATVYAPTLQVAGGALTPARLDNANTLYAPTLVMGAIAVTPNLLANASIVYLAILAVAAAPILPVAERTAGVANDPRTAEILSAQRAELLAARRAGTVPRDTRSTTIRKRSN